MLKKGGVCLYILLFFSCLTPRSKTSGFLDGFIPQWQPFEQGVDLLAGVVSRPKLRFWAARIDTSHLNLEIVISPREAVDGNFEANVVPASSVSRFVERFDCIVGVNASPFYPVSETEGEKRNIVGLTVSNGVVVSAPVARYDALVFYADGAMAIENQGAIRGAIRNGGSIWNAVGGFYAILKDGALTERAVSEQGEKRHPRSAAGIHGAILYLLVVDGRQLASVGATEAETALILQKLGAVDAINFDGGGSTALALRSQNHGVFVVNTPVHGLFSGKERAVASCVGVRKRRE
ncbi:MAG: phosphodiester glycosidase family protein [Treponema sp.]|jgi:exopolysaccharide biosynthesis protein|nr:phosphodiester glycosidase family protein [Treponema sp.]